MQKTTTASRFSTLFNPRLIEARLNGKFEERIYRGFGLTLHFRRKLAEPAKSGASALEQSVETNAPVEARESAIALSSAVALQEATNSTNDSDPAPALTPEQADGILKPGADELLSLLSARMHVAGREPFAPLEPAAVTAKLYPILTGKTVGVIGFSPEDSAAFGQALATQFCSFLFLNHADAEFRKGSTNGCDLLILLAQPEWVAPGSLHPASLLKTKKPLLTFGDRDVLATLATRAQGGLREFIPAPWSVGDAIWRAATLLGRAQETAVRAKRRTQRFSVIIADESPARVLVHAVLAQEGMECFVAGNGVDALGLARSKRADAVIVDVSLPGLDGFQVLAEIRRDPLLKETAVILLTARQAEADVLRGFGLGANDYVTKPFSPMELAARVKRFLVKTR